MSPAPRLLIASNNRHKIDEFRDLLAGCGWDVVGPSDLGLGIEVDETGRTYEDNARIKARAFEAAAGLPALADDSGLEVDALGGQPGPLHHVLGWDGADNADRLAIILRRLEGVANRTARFRAVVVVAFPDGTEIVGEGACEGEISGAPSGEAGFGYDPVFFLPDRGLTMAQLSPSEKNRISHRARAVAAIRARLAAAADTLA